MVQPTPPNTGVRRQQPTSDSGPSSHPNPGPETYHSSSSAPVNFYANLDPNASLNAPPRYPYPYDATLINPHINLNSYTSSALSPYANPHPNTSTAVFPPYTRPNPSAPPLFFSNRNINPFSAPLPPTHIDGILAPVGSPGVMPHDARPPVQGLLTPHANSNPTTSFTAIPPIPTGHLGSGVNTSESPDSDAVWVAPVSGIIGPKTRDHMDSIACEILGKIRKSGMSFDEAGRLAEVIEADERLRRFVFRSPETEGPQGLAAEAPQAINRREWLVPVEAVIVRPLDASVVELARLYLSQPRQSDSAYLKIGDIVKGINEAVTRAEESWFDEHTVTFCISETILLRIGDYDRVDDVETLQHIQRHSTGMPIPTVLGIMRQGARLYLFLTRPEGRPLEHYYRNLTRPDGISIRKHLDRIFRALRNIPLPPPTSSQPLDFENSARLGGGNPRRCKDLRGGLKISGSPVSCEVEFNHFLCTDPWPMDVWEMHLKDRFLENHEMVLTYANLHPANIIVAPRRRPDTEDGSTLQITGILNWELAGVYPAYWEYVKALNPMARRPLPLDWWWFVPPSIGIHAKEHALYALLPVVREREDQGSWADAAAFG